MILRMLSLACIVNLRIHSSGIQKILTIPALKPYLILLRGRIRMFG
nr:MAG TPA: hypothetical protein [Caudoviricetes sp.]